MHCAPLCNILCTAEVCITNPGIYSRICSVFYMQLFPDDVLHIQIKNISRQCSWLCRLSRCKLSHQHRTAESVHLSGNRQVDSTYFSSCYRYSSKFHSAQNTVCHTKQKEREKGIEGTIIINVDLNNDMPYFNEKV